MSLHAKNHQLGECTDFYGPQKLGAVLWPILMGNSVGVVVMAILI